MKNLILVITFLLSLSITCFSQSKIISITVRGFFNLEGRFSDNLVGKETIDLPQYLIDQTLITVEIYKVPEFGG